MTTGWDIDLYTVAAIVLLTVASLVTRTGYFLFGDRLPLPETVRQALRYAPTAALVAIIAPDLFPWGADDGPRVGIQALAAVVAVFLYVRTRSTLAVIGGGMVALWLLSWLAGR